VKLVLLLLLSGCVTVEPAGWDARTENGRHPEDLHDHRHRMVEDMRPRHQNDLDWTLALDSLWRRR
jgi:hypothetical protein